MRNFRITHRLGAMLLAVAATGAAPFPAHASYGESAIVDPNEALASSMRTLAADPKNLNALISAGRASLALGDVQAAAGFFGRADEAYPTSPLPKIGMGAALAMGGDAAGALAQFDKAQQLGAPPSMMAVDRGLALDLLGRQQEAQASYRMALPGPQGDEARRRMALSLAISRDIREAGKTIEPLLRRQDPASVRVNAFILALAGDRDGARRTIEQVMPGAGNSFDPFFQTLPILNPDEKAAAVHLGIFPKDAAQRFAQAQPVASSPVTTVANRSAEPRKTRRAEPRTERREAKKPERKRTERTAEAPRRAVREVEQPNTYLASIRPSLRSDRYASARRDQAAEERKRAKENERRRKLEQERARKQQASQQKTSSRRDDLAPLPATGQPPANSSVNRFATAKIDGPSAATAPPPAPRPKLEIATPPAPKPKVERLAANSVSTSNKAKQAPDIGAKGTYWVQLAGGQNKDWLDNEYRKLRDKEPSLFRGQTPHVTEGKEFFRLLVGPFDSPGDAHELVNKLKKAGIDSFTWTRKPARLKIEKISG